MFRQTVCHLQGVNSKGTGICRGTDILYTCILSGVFVDWH
jgi:hypothetical protein